MLTEHFFISFIIPLSPRGNSGLPMFDVMQSATTLNGGSYPAGGTGSRARDLGLRAQKKNFSAESYLQEPEDHC